MWEESFKLRWTLGFGLDARLADRLAAELDQIRHDLNLTYLNRPRRGPCRTAPTYYVPA